MYLKKGNYYNNSTFNPRKRILVFYSCATQDSKPNNFESIICFLYNYNCTKAMDPFETGH